jgi:hypothetical protein
VGYSHHSWSSFVNSPTPTPPFFLISIVTHGHGSQHASDGELLGCLKDMLKLPGQATVYIIIDALDECPTTTTGLPSPREKVLKLVEELVNLQIPNLRICVTSRPEADIIPVLEPLAFRSVSLKREWASPGHCRICQGPSFTRTVRCEDGRTRISNW